MFAAAEPVTFTSSPVPATAAGTTSSRRRVTRSVVASSWGGVVGTTVTTNASGAAGRLGTGGETVATPRGPGQRALQRRHRVGRVARPRDDGEDERAVEALAEALGQQVVGPQGVAALGVGALVGDAEPEGERRGSQDEQRDARGPEPPPRAPLDRPAPAVGGGLPQGPGGRPRDLPAQPADGDARDQDQDGEDGGGGGDGRQPRTGPEQGDRHQPGRDEAAPAGDLEPLAGQAEQGGQQGDGRDHRRQDGHRRPDRHPGDERDADEQQAQQRDHDGDAGEDHRPPGGVGGGRHRRPRREPVVRSPAEPGDDEQRVVDAHAEADHGADRQREVGHGVQVAEQQREGASRPDASHGDGDRQAHGEHRPERHDQDDHGERQPDQLGLGQRALAESGATGDHLEALERGSVLGDRLAEERGLGQVDVRREVHVGVRELAGQRPLPGDLAFALLGVGGDDRRAGVLRDALVVREPRLHEREQLLHRRRDLGVVDALVGPEHDGPRQAPGPEIGEVLLEDVEAGRAVGVGDVECRVVGRSDGPGRAEGSGQTRHPQSDGGDPVVEAPGADACEPHVHTVTDPGWLADVRRWHPGGGEPRWLHRNATRLRAGRNPSPAGSHGGTR